MADFTSQENPCALILQNGLYKTFNINRQFSFHQDLKTYFSSDEFKRELKEGKWGGGLSVIADSLPIKIGASASDQEITDFQKKVTQATSLVLDQTFYDYASTRVPDVEIAKAYTDCIAINRIYGFKVNAVVSDDSILFIVSFRNQIETDPMPKVTRFQVINSGNVAKSFNIGDYLSGETSISADRNPEKDVTLILETDRGIATYKVPAESSGFNKDLPIGTIISSYLNWSEFQLTTKNNSNNPIGNIWSAKYSKWAPADGRQVPNSGFLKITSQLNIPDLRGLFLRGLNQFDTDEQSIVEQNRKDPDDRIRGIFQQESFKSHDHVETANASIGANMMMDAGLLGLGSKSPNQQPTPYRTQVAGGDETRPKNISIYYYIRIN